MLDYTFREFLSEIEGNAFKNLVSKIRSIDLENENENQRDILKAMLPCVSLSGAGDKKRRGAKQLPKFDHSGLLQVDLDLDKHPSWDIDKMFEVVNDDKHVLASFRSPSGGVKSYCSNYK